MNMWLIIGAAFMLPLSAADLDAYLHEPSYKGNNENLPVGELLVANAEDISIDTLTLLACVSTHLQKKTSARLQHHRTALKKYIDATFSSPNCRITYSPNKLEVAVVEETDIEESDTKNKINFFWYIYWREKNTIHKLRTDYPRLEYPSKYLPFFTKACVCLISIDTMIQKNCPKKEIYSVYDTPYSRVIIWDRSRKSSYDGEFKIRCNKVSANAYWFQKTLPILYEKIMQRPYHYARAKNGTLSINLAHRDFLTENDVHILSKFIPGGTHEKWCDIPKKYGYFLLNLLACYGSPHALLKEIDAQVGKQKIKWAGVGKAQVSRCTDTIDVLTNEGKIASFIRDSRLQQLSATAKATLDYVAQLKKEGVFVEKDWSNEDTLKKRVNWYNQAIQFLRHKRMTWFQHGKDKCIRFDAFDQQFTVFQCTDEDIQAIDTAQWFSKKVDIHDFAKEKYKGNYSAMFKDLYETVGTSSDSESSDVLVESSDDE